MHDTTFGRDAALARHEYAALEELPRIVLQISRTIAFHDIQISLC